MSKLNLFQLIFSVFTIAISWIVGYMFYFGFAIIVRPQFGKNREETLYLRDNFCIEKGFENLIVSFITAIFLAFIFYYIKKNKKKYLFIFIIYILILNF